MDASARGLKLLTALLRSRPDPMNSALPTSRELLGLVLARQADIRSFEARYTSYQYVESQPALERVLAVQFDALFRAAEDSRYGEFQEKRFSTKGREGDFQLERCLYASKAGCARRLEMRDPPFPSKGLIASPEDLHPLGGGPIAIMFDVLSPWDELLKLPPEDFVVERDKDTGLLILSVQQPNGWHLTVEVDPLKGYMPVRSEVLTDDGAVRHESRRDAWIAENLLDRNSGRMVPTEITIIYDIGDGEKTFLEFKFHSISVNPAIDAEQMTFQFPKGTVVDDQMANRQYRIGAI